MTDRTDLITEEAGDLLADEWPVELGWTNWMERRAHVDRIFDILHTHGYAITRAETTTRRRATWTELRILTSEGRDE